MTAETHFQEAGRATANGIILAAAALMSIGLVAVASASASLDGPVLQPELWKTTLGRQGLFTVLGLVTLLVMARVGAGPLRWRTGSWWQPSLGLFGVTLLLLILVLIPGIGAERHGARRWLRFGPDALGLGFQPSELAKLALVVFLAAHLSGRGELLRRFFKGAVPAALVVGVCAALVGTEDFGTAALLAVVGGLILLVAGARIVHLMLLALPAAGAFGLLLMMKPYRLKRLTAFMDIWSDPQGEGYHAVQSLIGIAGGGWFGQGLGSSVQKYGYLPESRTDFVFAVWAEETGLFGCLVVLLLYGLLLYLGTRAAAAAASAFERLLAIGVTLMITLQAAMNIAVVTASVPTKGIALPLVSAGGSGTVFFSAALGLMAGVALRGRYLARAEVSRAGLLQAGAPARSWR